MIENEHQLAVTQRKLALIEARIEEAMKEPASVARDYSCRSLKRMRKQMLEEIIRFRARTAEDASAS